MYHTYIFFHTNTPNIFPLHDSLITTLTNLHIVIMLIKFSSLSSIMLKAQRGSSHSIGNNSSHDDKVKTSTDHKFHTTFWSPTARLVIIDKYKFPTMVITRQYLPRKKNHKSNNKGHFPLKGYIYKQVLLPSIFRQHSQAQRKNILYVKVNIVHNNFTFLWYS